MEGGDALAALLERTDHVRSRPLRQSLFPNADAAAISGALSRFVEAAVAPIAAPLFVRASVGLVIGLALADGRRVVVKVHRGNVSVARLAAIQAVQSHLVAAGLPVPAPLAPPTALGAGLATIERLLPGDRADGHDRRVRDRMAAGLADLIAAAASVGPLPPLGHGILHPAGREWPQPHDPRFDFEATASGAEWIDDLAEQGRSTLRATLRATELPDVIAHLDWRVENLGFAGTGIVAIYDWDSLGLVPEAVAVGQAAAQYSSDWSSGASTLPSVAEMQSFVTSYERHRGRPFEEHERAALDAANLLLCAYGARCQHSDRALHPELAGEEGSGWARLLRERGEHAFG